MEWTSKMNGIIQYLIKLQYLYIHFTVYLFPLQFFDLHVSFSNLCILAVQSTFQSDCSSRFPSILSLCPQVSFFAFAAVVLSSLSLTASPALSFAAVCRCLRFWMSWKSWKRGGRVEREGRDVEKLLTKIV